VDFPFAFTITIKCCEAQSHTALTLSYLMQTYSRSAYNSRRPLYTCFDFSPLQYLPSSPADGGVSISIESPYFRKGFDNFRVCIAPVMIRAQGAVHPGAEASSHHYLVMLRLEVQIGTPHFEHDTQHQTRRLRHVSLRSWTRRLLCREITGLVYLLSDLPLSRRTLACRGS
jgi:hypothetical protein